MDPNEKPIGWTLEELEAGIKTVTDEDRKVHWKDLINARMKAFDLAVAHGMIGTMESLEQMQIAKVEYSAICHRAIAQGVRGLGDD